MFHADGPARPGARTRIIAFRGVGVIDKIKGFFATVGSLGIGAFLYFAPPEVREDVPFHKEAGVAFCAYGLLFGLVMVLGPEKGLGRRLKYLLVGLALASLSGLAYFAAREDGDLASWGLCAFFGIGATYCVGGFLLGPPKKHPDEP